MTRNDLPTGTVTFLFTDIEGSTRLLHTLGPAAYADALAEHRRATREAVARHGGVEVDTQGDAFFIAFPTAAHAAAAAMAAQDAMAAGPVRVRMGLHTGTPSITGEGYVGGDVHRGARIAALAHGGQTLLSPATAALIEGRQLVDLGVHRLKDFDAATRVYQLGPGEFAPLRTPGSVALPTPVTPFLGREHELFDAVSTVLERDPRVLTIVGPGGTGKTRFAIELARLLAEEADGGTIFVPLAPLRDPGLVLPTLADAVGAETADPQSIGARIGAERTHVVLDNMEQLLPDAARAVAATVEAAPQLRLLVTSRETLRVAAETEFDLPPLAADEAVELFLTRARTVRSDVSRTPTVERLCERLDRLPLALELAAARTKLLGPEALLERLGDSLDVLRGTRDADPRHATLEATIAWSYGLLEPQEQRVFAALAVFRGGCTLAAAEAVCDAGLDTLASLLDKSLLRRRTDPDGSDRVWMLETIRAFASARLAETDREDELRRRQSVALLQLAERADTRASVEGSIHLRVDLITPELDNIRAVLDWACARDPERGLDLATALEEFWVVREPQEGAGWLERLLTPARDAPTKLRASATRALAGLYATLGDHDRAAPLYRDSLELFEGLGDRLHVANLRFRLAANMVSRGEVAAASPLLDDALREFRRLDHRIGEAGALSYLGFKARHEGDLAAAVKHFEESAALVCELDWPWWEATMLANLAETERRRGRIESARRYARRSLELSLELGDRLQAVLASAELAGAAALSGDAAAAGRLWGAIETEESIAPLGQWPRPQGGGVARPAYESAIAHAAGREFEQARGEGRLLSLAEAAGLD